MLPALTVQTPSASRSGRALAHGVGRAAQLEGAHRLQVLQLQVQLGGAVGVETHERRPERRAADALAGGADVVQGDLGVGFGHRVVLYAIVLVQG